VVLWPRVTALHWSGPWSRTPPARSVTRRTLRRTMPG